MMNKNIIDLTQIEKTLSNIDVTLSKKNTEYKVVIPQLEEIEKSLNDVKQIVIQNDKLERVKKKTVVKDITSYTKTEYIEIPMELSMSLGKDAFLPRKH